MVDNQQAEKPAEEQAQQSPMPSEEQKGQEVADSQEEVQETEESLEAPAGESEMELPKGVSERTSEQFEKLKAQLMETRQRLFRQTGSQEYAGEAQVKPLYDPATGLVNLEALTDLQKRAYAAENKANRLEQRFVQEGQDAEVRELYEVHPELKNPKSKEIKELFDDAERIWMHSLAYPEKYGGYALTQKQAADLAKKRIGVRPETTKEEAQRLEAKEQASFGASGRPTQGVQSKITSEEELKRLQFGTRVGDKDSMIARMRAIREAQGSK